MLSKLWATYEMNFWERKIHRALECKFDLSDSTVKRFGATQINPPTNISAKIRLI